MKLMLSNVTDGPTSVNKYDAVSSSATYLVTADAAGWIVRDPPEANVVSRSSGVCSVSFSWIVVVRVVRWS